MYICRGFIIVVDRRMRGIKESEREDSNRVTKLAIFKAKTIKTRFEILGVTI
jgi:hypothetical protein